MQCEVGIKISSLLSTYNFNRCDDMVTRLLISEPEIQYSKPRFFIQVFKVNLYLAENFKLLFATQHNNTYTKVKTCEVAVKVVNQGK